MRYNKDSERNIPAAKADGVGYAELHIVTVIPPSH